MIQRNFALVRTWLVNLPRFHKRVALVLNDMLLLSLALWLALSFRYLRVYVPDSIELAMLFAAAPIIAVVVFFYGGVYRVVTRYIGAKGTTKVLLYLGLSVLFWALIVLMSGLKGVPRSAVVLYWFIASALIYGSRHMAAWLLQGAGFALLREKANPTAVAIFGAGQTGLELLESLRRAGDSNVIGFLDTTPSLVGQYIAGVKVYQPEKLASMVTRHGVKCVYLAQSLATRRERAETLKWLQGFPVRVQVLPAIDDLASGRVNVSALREVEVEDLLTRDPAPAISELIDRAANRKCVMVTGAGGSIGAELVRKLVRQGARKIVLFELAESALYEIDMEARDIVRQLGSDIQSPEIVAILGSVHDRALVTQVIVAHAVDTICHAAAYKHVPLVESNTVVGLDNNVFGTAVLAEVARRHGVERFVLISSDKAVRPTNIMGASKRLSELILQGHASDPGCECIFTIVRFGNVLDSSGSVMRLFRKQIAAGGPVTVTHRDVIRYFMSIPEAVELVLQAAGLGVGGEVFVLEMGEPVRIDDLARSMIRLAGLECRDDANPTGDVEIEYTGLRPGEKLFEELLIGGSQTPTEHPRILRSDEPYLAADELARELDALRLAMKANDVVSIQAILSRVVEGYRAAPSIAGDPTAAPVGAQALWQPVSRTLH
ncbi:MAG: nucleoside-diphosphate sugar epimerase/dehydratase [Hyphomicrobiaceae bacterium]